MTNVRLRRWLLAPATLLALGSAAAVAQTPPSPRDAARPVSAPALPAPADRPWLDKAKPPAERAHLLVQAMSLEEKVSLLSGSGGKAQDGHQWQVHMRGIPRLGIPDMTQGDTPNGLFIGGPDVVQMPNELALGATFSRADALAYGDTLGAEVRAMGYGVLHGPNIDINRDPRHGRTHETLGEDPVLTAQLAIPYIEGIQRHRVMADAKHFVANSVEKGRMGLDAQIDDRTLNELYLPAFRDVIEDSKLGMIMCAYNKINGVQACDRPDLLDKLARQTWGFQGIIRGDGGAFHSLESITAGLDQELPVTLAWGDRLLAAVKDGRIPVSAVDTAVERVLRTMMIYGIFDDPPQPTGADVAADSQVAERIAARSAVLLKNHGGLLPLSDKSVRRIAVLGPAADDLTLAGGLANPAPKGKVTILDGLRARAHGVAIDYQPGVDPIAGVAEAPGFPTVASAALADKSGQAGAEAVYYDAQGAVVGRQTDTCLCFVGAGIFNGNAKNPHSPPRAVRVVWTAQLKIDSAGRYGFDIVTNGNAELKIDDAEVVSVRESPAMQRAAASKTLSVGAHRLEASYALGARWREAPERGSGVAPRLKIGWRRPAGVIDAKIRAAADAAKQADVAIVVVRDFESEGMDRASLSLPNDQDRLIEAVAKANPRTIVVLSTGSAVLMPWLNRTAAVVEAWYGGTRGGPALAQVLFGDVNPSGRLPVTFPAREEDMATFDPARFPGDGKVTVFGEKMSTGYRRFTAPGGPKPLFPFGYGLSYTTFAYSGLTLDRTALKAGLLRKDRTFKGQPGVTVSFVVRNTGLRAGAVTPQVYVDYPAVAGEPAPLLKGFDKVELAPGQAKTVRIVLDQQAFASWEAAAGGWRLAPGIYKVRVGDAAGATAMVAPVALQ